MSKYDFPTTRKLIDTPPPVAKEVEPLPGLDDSEVSLDKMSRRVLRSLEWATRNIEHAMKHGDISRETIGSLKDCQIMIRDLKKEEKDYIDSLTDEQLNELASKNK